MGNKCQSPTAKEHYQVSSGPPSNKKLHTCRLKGRKVKKNYPVGFPILSSSMAIVDSEMLGMEIIVLRILEF